MARLSSDVVAEKILNIEKGVDLINSKLERSYVSKEELLLVSDRVNRVEKVVYGMVGLILIAVVGALLNLVLRGGS